MKKLVLLETAPPPAWSERIIEVQAQRLDPHLTELNSLCGSSFYISSRILIGMLSILISQEYTIASVDLERFGRSQDMIL